MRPNRIQYIGIITLLAGGIALQSCSQQEPDTASEGELSITTNILTRLSGDDSSTGTGSEEETQESTLAEKCVVYISGKAGLLHKWKGLENVPASIVLKGGEYVVEAWSGDSVSASFDKKFYRGHQPVIIKPGPNKVELTCKIANVVVSINPESIDTELIRDWKISVANTRGKLDFTSENVKESKGYFMMPNNDTELNYTITGTGTTGKSIRHTGKIENPRRGHEYVLNLSFITSRAADSGIRVRVTDKEIK